jgi:hypothetical protein
MTADLGPMPEPQIEPPEPNPGGADAIDGNDMPPAVPDLTPAKNPGIEDEAPDELSEGEDTATEGTAGKDGGDDTQQKESSG